MPPQLQHLRSTTLDKRPDPALMADGQMAQNQAPTSPGAFIKDAAGGLVKIGPTHVGPTAPNSAPTGFAGNTLGEQWVDTAGPKPILKTWDGVQWLASGGGATVETGDIAPVNPVNGDLWFRTDRAELFIWYNDGDSGQWVEVTTGGGGGGAAGDFVLKTGDVMSGSLTVPKLLVGPNGGASVDVDPTLGALRFYESGGSQRGAVLEVDDCVPGVGSRILTNVNSKYINEFRHTPGLVLSDMSTLHLIHQIYFTGVNSIFCTAWASFEYAGGGKVGAIATATLYDSAVNLIASTYQGVRGDALVIPGMQLGATTCLSRISLDPAETYQVQLLVNKDGPVGPIRVWDAGLAMTGQSIVTGT